MPQQAKPSQITAYFTESLKKMDYYIATELPNGVLVTYGALRFIVYLRGTNPNVSVDISLSRNVTTSDVESIISAIAFLTATAQDWVTVGRKQAGLN